VDILYDNPTTFSSVYSATKTLEIISNVDVWTSSILPSVSCIVASFTNAAGITQRRSLLQVNPVEISMVKADNTIVGGAASATGQFFPAVISAPVQRNLYLPKATGNSLLLAWMCVTFCVIISWL